MTTLQQHYTRSTDEFQGERSVLNAALTYIGYGWSVLPIWGVKSGACACPKGVDCGKQAGKHPIHDLAPN
jgi:hypothetical protein